MQTALVTGTSTGIGRETALHFARQGYRVFAGVRNPKQLDVDHDDSVHGCVRES
jgi:NAD(P)-dependent dehydrogenase (short-subunit alcohol dehydrogenase family)